MSHEWRRGGFSMSELLVVLAISAILLSLAVPEMGEAIRRQQLKAAANDLFGAIGLTRSQAIARGIRVELIPAGPGGANWSGGWVVFVDRDGDRRPGSGDEIIATHGPLASGIAVDSAFSGNQGALYIAYNGAGRGCTDSSSLAARWGTVSLFQGMQTRRIKINMLGRARICDPARDGSACEGAERPD